MFLMSAIRRRKRKSRIRRVFAAVFAAIRLWWLPWG
jgi:hypothetical protein